MRYILFLLVIVASLSHAAIAPSTLLMNAKTGEILFQQHAHVQRFPASLTKLMTIYIAFDRLRSGRMRPNDLVRISKKAAAACPTKLYLKVNDHISVIDAILALAVKSANDIAIALAEHMEEDEDIFAEVMNKKAQELGMTQTIFRNASGLPNKEQVATARDLAVLAKALLDHYPEYRHIFSTQYFSFRGKKYKNTNSLLGSMEGVDGMKTGYTWAAGWNLVTSYHRGNDHLIGVVMGERSKNRRDLHMRALLEGRPLSANEIRRITIRTPDYFKQRAPLIRWGVQVGVFRSSSQAHVYGKTIKKNYAAILKDIPYHIGTKIKKSMRVFHTRFHFGNEERAREVCAALKKRGVDCFVVSG